MSEAWESYRAHLSYGEKWREKVTHIHDTDLPAPMFTHSENSFRSLSASRLLFRCSHGRTEGKWCSYKQLMVDSSRHGNASQSQLSSRVNAAPGRALKDVNVFSHKDGTNPLQKLKSNATMNSEKPKETSEKSKRKYFFVIMIITVLRAIMIGKMVIVTVTVVKQNSLYGKVLCSSM